MFVRVVLVVSALALAGCATDHPRKAAPPQADPASSYPITDTLRGCTMSLSEPDHGVVRAIVACDATAEGNATFRLAIPCPAHSRDDQIAQQNWLSSGAVDVTLWAGDNVTAAYTMEPGTTEVPVIDFMRLRQDTPFFLEVEHPEGTFGAFEVLVECGSWP